MRSQPPNLNVEPSTKAHEAHASQQSAAAAPFLFLELPTEIQIEVATHAPLQTVGRLVRASSATAQLFSTNEAAWKQIVERHLTLEPRMQDGEKYRSFYKRKHIRAQDLMRSGKSMHAIALKNGWEQVIRANPVANNVESLKKIIDHFGGYRGMSQYIFEEAKALDTPNNAQAPNQPRSLASQEVLAYWATLPFIKHVKATLPPDHLLYTKVLPLFTLDDWAAAQRVTTLDARNILLKYAEVADESGFKKILEKIPVAEQQTYLLELLIMSLFFSGGSINLTFKRKNAIRLLLNFTDKEKRDQLITELRVKTEQILQHNRIIKFVDLSMVTPFMRDSYPWLQNALLEIPVVWFFIQLCHEQKVPAFDLELQALVNSGACAKVDLILMAGLDHPSVENMLQNPAVVEGVFRLMLMGNNHYCEIKSILAFIPFSDNRKFSQEFLQGFLVNIFSNYKTIANLADVTIRVSRFYRRLEKFLLMNSLHANFDNTPVFERINEINLCYLQTERHLYNGITVKGIFDRFPIVRTCYVEALRERLEKALRDGNSTEIKEIIQKFPLECMKEVAEIIIPWLVEALAKKEMAESAGGILEEYFARVESGKAHSDYYLCFFRDIFAIFIDLDISQEKRLLQAICRNGSTMLATYLYFLSDTNDESNNLNNSQIKRVLSLLNESSCIGLVFGFFMFQNFHIKGPNGYENRVIGAALDANRRMKRNHHFEYKKPDRPNAGADAATSIFMYKVFDSLLDMAENVVVRDKCQALLRSFVASGSSALAESSETVATSTKQRLPDFRDIDFTQWRIDWRHSIFSLIRFDVGDFTGAKLIYPNEFNDFDKLKSLFAQIERNQSYPRVGFKLILENVLSHCQELKSNKQYRQALDLLNLCFKDQRLRPEINFTIPDFMSEKLISADEFNDLDKLKSILNQMREVPEMRVIALECVLSYCQELKKNRRYDQALNILNFCFDEPIFSEHKTPDGEKRCKNFNTVTFGLFARTNLATTTRQRRLLALIEEIEAAKSRDAELSRVH